MKYQLNNFAIKGMSLDDVKKEIHIQVDILVGIEGSDNRFKTNNSNIDFIIKAHQ